jgi:hypothetical protein
MKALIFAVILVAAGYFAYQYYNESLTETSSEPGGDGAASYGYVPPIPAECEGKAGNMGDALYGYDIGRVSVAQLNFATRSFQSCLRDAGFSDAEINAAYDTIKEDVMSLNPGSAQGY